MLRTSTDGTRLAIRIANDLAHAVAARLTLIDLRPVPNRDQPSIPGGEADWTTAFVERLRSQGLDIGVRFYVCRDERQAIPFAFRPNSLIVIGGKRLVADSNRTPAESARGGRPLRPVCRRFYSS